MQFRSIRISQVEDLKHKVVVGKTSAADEQVFPVRTRSHYVNLLYLLLEVNETHLVILAFFQVAYGNMMAYYILVHGNLPTG